MCSKGPVPKNVKSITFTVVSQIGANSEINFFPSTPKSLVNFNFPKKKIRFPGNQIFRKSFVLPIDTNLTVVLLQFLTATEWRSG